MFDTGCNTGSGADVIELEAGQVYQMSSILDDPYNPLGPAANPIILSDITLEANGAQLLRPNPGRNFVSPNFRAFAVALKVFSDPDGDLPIAGDGIGKLTIRNAYVKGFTAKGGNGAAGGGGGLGAGGAVFVSRGILVVDRSTFEDNGAGGGNGSSGNFGGGGGGTISPGGEGPTSFGGYRCGGHGGNSLTTIFRDGEEGKCAGGGGGGGAYKVEFGDGGHGGFGGGGGANIGDSNVTGFGPSGPIRATGAFT